MKSLHIPSRKTILRGVWVFVSLAGLVLLHPQLADFLAWVGDRDAVTATMFRLGIWGPLVLVILLVMQVFLAVIPGHALMLAGGYVYGFALSLALTLVGTVLGSQVAFMVSRWYGRRLVYRLASPQVLERWDHLGANQGGIFYFFTFVLPIFPSDLMCYVAGLGTVAPRHFFLANLSGRLVCAMFITLVGSHGLQMPVYFWVMAIVVLALFYTGWLIYSRRSKVMLGTFKV